MTPPKENAQHFKKWYLKRKVILRKFTIGGGKYRSVCRTSFAYPPPFYFRPAGAMTSSLLSRRVENKKKPFPRNTTFWDPHPITWLLQLPFGLLNIRTLFPFSLHFYFFHYSGFLTHMEMKRFFYRVWSHLCGCESATEMRIPQEQESAVRFWHRFPVLNLC